jgi:hypothetical protein
MEKGSFASLISGRVSSFLLHSQSLGLRTDMDVVENGNISLYLRSGHGARGMCLCLRSGAVQKRNVCMSSV